MVSQQFVLASFRQLLFCSSEDDFTFSTREANATFSGSGTIIIEATANGGFKFIPLEAKGTIRTPKGDAQDVRGGRLLWFLENQLLWRCLRH